MFIRWLTLLFRVLLNVLLKKWQNILGMSNKAKEFFMSIGLGRDSRACAYTTAMIYYCHQLTLHYTYTEIYSVTNYLIIIDYIQINKRAQNNQ